MSNNVVGGKDEEIRRDLEFSPGKEASRREDGGAELSEEALTEVAGGCGGHPPPGA